MANNPASSSAEKGKERIGAKRLLTNDLMTEFVPSRVFNKAVAQPPPPEAGKPELPKNHVTSMAFDRSGLLCITAGEDEIMSYWDMYKGERKTYFASKKYGIEHIAPTQETLHLLHTSTRAAKGDPIQDNAIRWHDGPQNGYKAYFAGHTDRVCSISVHPTAQTFISGSNDQTVLYWDLRDPAPKGRLTQMQGPCLTAWDPTGNIWAVGLPNSCYVCLYSATSFDAAPFKHAELRDPEMEKHSSPPRSPYITSLKFSNNGHYILLGCSGPYHYVMDAYELKVVARLRGHEGLEKDKKGERGVAAARGISGAEVCWTPDSQFVMSGSHDGRVLIWDLKPPEHHNKWPIPLSQDGFSPAHVPTLDPTTTLNEEKLGGPTRAVAFSSKVMAFATAGSAVTLWLPSKKEKEPEPDPDPDSMDVTWTL